MLPRGITLAAQHAGEFGDAGFAVERGDLRNGAAVLDLFGHELLGSLLVRIASQLGLALNEWELDFNHTLLILHP